MPDSAKRLHKQSCLLSSSTTMLQRTRSISRAIRVSKELEALVTLPLYRHDSFRETAKGRKGCTQSSLYRSLACCSCSRREVNSTRRRSLKEPAVVSIHLFSRRQIYSQHEKLTRYLREAQSEVWDSLKPYCFVVSYLLLRGSLKAEDKKVTEKSKVLQFLGWYLRSKVLRIILLYQKEWV